jgi:hypothetical protein
MTVSELIAALQSLGQPNLDVRIYVGHLGGQAEKSVAHVDIERDDYDLEKPDIRVILQ